VALEETFVDAPETPAPIFAVRAFKHALWGTPKPEPDEKTALLAADSAPPSRSEDRTQLKPPKDAEIERPSSPNKGILMTPGTVAGRRKQVKFGEHVVDNEGKKPLFGRSGIPSNCPGKFPSPWTPRSTDLPEMDLDQGQPKATSGTTAEQAAIAEAIPTRADIEELKGKQRPNLSAKTIKAPKSPQRPRAKDDGDITLDFMAPRSESGRYWRDQYMSYSLASEEEVRKLIAKAKLAKNFARKKDEEATELRLQLESEKKKRAAREKSLEKQVKDLRERLRQALAENAKASTELGVLKQTVERISGSALSVPTVSLQTAQTPTDAIWSDAAVFTDNESDLPAKPLRRKRRPLKRSESARESRRVEEKVTTTIPSARKRPETFSSTQTQSNPNPYQSATDASALLDFTRTQLSPIRGSPASMATATSVLTERNLNTLNVQPTVYDKGRLTPRKSPSRHNRHGAVFDFSPGRPGGGQVFDASAPLEALAAQAEQPVTPQSGFEKRAEISQSKLSERKDRRHHGGAPNIDKERMEAAKARIAARRKASGKAGGGLPR
jgi:Cut12 conserved domain